MGGKVNLERVKTWVSDNTTSTLDPDQVYTDCRVKLNFTCKVGHRFTKSWSELLQGGGCIECAGNKKKGIEEVNQWVVEHTSFELLPYQTYTNNRTPLKFLCEKGHEFSASWDSVHHGRGCLECSGLARKTTSGVKSELLSKGLTLTQDYTNTYSKMRLTCEKGHTFFASRSSVLQGHGCPHCFKKSEGKLKELLAEKFLVEPQYQIPCDAEWSKSGKIKVDFFLPEIYTVVEYHGKQHYEWLPFIHKTEDKFKAQQTRDHWLRNYCEENQINYWEIPYLDFDHNSTELPCIVARKIDIK